MDPAPPMDAVETFMGITGASQAVAIRMLEDNGGDLNAAVNAFFNEGDVSLPPLQREEPERIDYMDEDEPVAPPAVVQEPRGILSRPMFDPFRSILGERDPPAPGGPFVSHPRDIRNVPIDWQDTPAAAPPNLSIQEVTDQDNVPRGGASGIVSMEDDFPAFRGAGTYPRRSPERDPFTPQVAEVPSVPSVDYEVEEQILQSVIEASKRDAERGNDSTGDATGQTVPLSEDDEIARAVSLSLKTAEEEKRWRDLTYDDADVPLTEDTARRENPVSSSGASGTSSFVAPPTSTLLEDTEDPDEQPLLRRRSRRVIPVDEPSADIRPVVPSRSTDEDHVPSAPQPNGDMLPSDEWGGISSEEQDEAVMLEAALFGGVQYPTDSRRAAPAPPSPSVVAQRLLREQQDDEYLASLAADREKELKAKQEAEAASEMEKLRKEEEQRKSEAEAELERKLAAKAESLPPEPTQEDENAVTILVRLPDGSRHGRRFRKSDKLQNLFDFIDLSRAVKPGTYRLVRQYPRRAFTDQEHAASFDTLGLTSKQEALFLETI